MRLVQLLEPRAVLPAIRVDLLQTKSLRAQVYSLDPTFAAELFSNLDVLTPCRLLVDYRQVDAVKELARLRPQIQARRWASNRTMHDKCLILTGPDAVYLTTANMNKGAYFLSINSTVRVCTPLFHEEMRTRFDELWARGRQIL